MSSTSWRLLYGLAALAALVAILWVVGAVMMKLERKELRRKAERILEIVETVEGSSDVVFRGEGTAVELDRELSGLLEIPDRTVVVPKPGIEVVEIPSVLRKGRKGSIDRVLGYYRYLSRRERAVPFDVRLETGSETSHLRGTVLPLGRPALSSEPLIALLGSVVARGTPRTPASCSAAPSGGERVFSVLSVLLTLGSYELRRLARARRSRSGGGRGRSRRRRGGGAGGRRGRDGVRRDRCRGRGGR
ncbi:hypothetical protein [Methanopyrus kandleri]